MGATDRMRLYLENKGITKYAFYKKTGFSNKFLDNSSNMGTDKAEIILRYYPDINPEWLICGKLPMLRDEAGKNQPYGTTSQKSFVAESQVLYDTGKMSDLQNKILELEETNRKLANSNTQLIITNSTLVETNARLTNEICQLKNEGKDTPRTAGAV